MGVSKEEVEDAKALFGISNQPKWQYKNILVEYYHTDDTPYECKEVDGKIRVWISSNKNYDIFIEFRPKGNSYDVYKSLINPWSDFLSGYNYEITISKKLGDSFIRYFKGRPRKIDINRLKDYFRKHSYYGLDWLTLWYRRHNPRKLKHALQRWR